MTDKHDPRYLALMNDVFEGLADYYSANLSDEAIRARLIDESVGHYRNTGDDQADYAVLRDKVEIRLDAIDLEHMEASGLDYDTLVSEVGQHEAAELVMIDRNPVNGFVTFKFYDRGGSLAGKISFDALEDDMAGRANAVLDHLSSITHTVVFQDEILQVWDGYDPNASTSMKA